MTSLWWLLPYVCLFGAGNAMKCHEIGNSSLPCVEVPHCFSNTSVSAVDVQLLELADGNGRASSYSNLSICFNESGLYITQANFDQGLWTASSAITECNDPVRNSNSASIYITPDTEPNMQCFTEFDVNPVNISYHAGVFVSRLPVPPQSFEMDCNSSGLESDTMIETSHDYWQVDFFLAFSTINCPYNCPTPQSNCAGLNTNSSLGNDDDARFADAKSVYRANFFRVNEMNVLTGNGQCTALQNSGKCQTSAWTPTSDLYNTSNFGYLLLQLEEDDDEVGDYSFDNNFEDMYIDVMIITAVFVFLGLLIYLWCFQNLRQNKLVPRAMVVRHTHPGPAVDVSIRDLSYYVEVPDEMMATTDSNLCTFTKIGKGYFKQLLHSVSLTIQKNKVTAIMGPSGAG
jgi:hypothetical protein